LPTNGDDVDRVPVRTVQCMQPNISASRKNTLRKWAGRGDIPMHRNPANGYRFFKRRDFAFGIVPSTMARQHQRSTHHSSIRCRPIIWSTCTTTGRLDSVSPVPRKSCC